MIAASMSLVLMPKKKIRVIIFATIHFIGRPGPKYEWKEFGANDYLILKVSSSRYYSIMNSISEVGNCKEKVHTKNGANRWDSISRYTFLFLWNGALFSNTKNPLLIANGSSSDLEVCDTDFVLVSPSDTVHILPRRKFVPQNRIAAPNWELNNRKKRVYLSIHYFFRVCCVCAAWCLLLI